MKQDEIIEMARQAGMYQDLNVSWNQPIQNFAKLVAAKEREIIADQFWGCVMSDLEHGVKSLNEKAAFDFQKNMPDLSKFGRWLDERGQA